MRRRWSPWIENWTIRKVRLVPGHSRAIAWSNMARFLVQALTMAWVLGCGGEGPSGVRQDKRPSDLTAAEVMQVCEWVVDAVDGPRVVDCPSEIPEGDWVVEFRAVNTCIEAYRSLSTDCQPTVGDVEACTRALAADPCHGYDAPACAPLLSEPSSCCGIITYCS